MSRIVARYVKQPGEKLQYRMDYSCWLGIGETITGATVTAARVLPDSSAGTLTIGGPYIAGASDVVEYLLNFGEDGDEYLITIRATTTSVQTVEREVTLSVEET
tara:strand:- start:5938 stop:6249 length:312 start_codon:yes stop_codon:yes gene_type:complete